MNRVYDMSISIKDIASLAGVSTATVSRVINSTGNVSPKTKARVEAVIARYGYVPNLVAKGLRTNLMPTVGIMVPDILNEPYGLFVRTAQQLLLKHGIISTICNTNDNPEITQEYVNILKSQNVSGIIYVPDSNSENIQFGNLPVVYIEHWPSHSLSPNSVVVCSDDINGGYIATKELLEKGCRNIAIYMDSSGISSFKNRYLGYCKALKEYGLKPKAGNTILVNPIHSTDVIRKTNKIIQNGFPFDGVFCTANRITIGAMCALTIAGLIQSNSKYNKVKLVGYEDIRISSYGYFLVTTVAVQTENIASTAVEELINLLKGNPPTKQEHTLPVHLIRRATT